MKIVDTAPEEESSVSMTPLIDMVFLLLIFFLVATTFTQEEREQSVALPGSSSPKPLAAPPKQIIINIMQDGTIKVSAQKYSFEQLAAMLKEVAKTQSEREVLVRADKDSRHEFFARVVETAHAAGIDKTKIGYILQGEGQ